LLPAGKIVPEKGKALKGKKGTPVVQPESQESKKDR
jgi:hypothetical protein